MSLRTLTKMLIATLLVVLTSAISVQAQEQVQISADTFVVEEDRTQATFSGEVVVVQGSLTVHANTVIVHYGQGGTSDIRSLEAFGALRIITPDQQVTGQRGTYNPKTRVMHVTGDVRVTSASGTVTGPALDVDFKNGTTRFASQGGGRVTGVFNP